MFQVDVSTGGARSTARTSLGLGVVVAALSLACGGGGGPDIPGASTPHLVQTSEGIFDGDGAFLSAEGARFTDSDVLVLDAKQSQFFVLSEGNTARLAEQADGGWNLRVVSDDSRVVRVFGEVAFVERGDDLLVLSSDGTTLHSDLQPYQSGVGSYPSDLAPNRGEYWWTPVLAALPQPVCTRGVPVFKRSCTWLKGDGSPLVKGTFTTVSGFELGSATAYQKGEGWVQVSLDGTVTSLGLPDGFEPLGPASPSGAVIGGLEEDFQTNVGRGRLAVKGKLVDLGHDIYSGEVWCTDGTGCDYRFADGLAAVRVRLPGESRLATGYITEEGAWAIAPAACANAMMSGPFHDGRAFHCEGDVYWMIDRTGAHLAGPYSAWREESQQQSLGRFIDNYPSGLFFADGLAAVPVVGGWGYADPSGALVLPGPYEVARPFRSGLATVVQDGTSRTIRKDGVEVMQRP